MKILSLALPYIQILISLFLIASILIQQRGAGLSEAFGGSSGGVYYRKRGFEKILFITTVILSFLFILSNIASFLI